MEAYFNNIVSALMTTVFFVFFIAAAGYLVGSIKIKGLSLGTAGVLLVALLFGIIASYVPYFSLGEKNIVLYLSKAVTLESGAVVSANSSVFSFTSNIGTAMFVTAVGLIAGPKFFRGFNKKSLGYILIGVTVILVATTLAVVMIKISDDSDLDSSLVTGLLTGALTSTPGLSAAKEIAADEAKVTAGYGIAYLFGVLGVVLFVQLMPRLLKVNLPEERKKFVAANNIDVPTVQHKLTAIDPLGIGAFAITIVIGMLIGCIKIPGINFSLGSSGGTLVAGLIVGHFGRIGRIDCRVSKNTLNFFRELGLCLFLIGAGVPGGVNFISNVKLSYFFYGAILTLLPMLVGFAIAKYCFKMSLFNTLASITGGMTSTPALGSLISVAETDEVTAAYAATYPIALVCVVLAAKIIVLIM